MELRHIGIPISVLEEISLAFLKEWEVLTSVSQLNCLNKPIESYGGKLFENTLDDVEHKNKHYEFIICKEITTDQLFNYEEIYLNYKMLPVKNISFLFQNFTTYYKEQVAILA